MVEAIAEFRATLRLSPGTIGTQLAIGEIFVQEGDAGAALADLVRKYEKTAAYGIATALAYRGEADRAFEVKVPQYRRAAQPNCCRHSLSFARSFRCQG
jgi:hypothetical protein